MAHVRLALRFDLRAPGLEAGDLAEFYAAAVDMCEWADGLGFERVTLSEHHGSDDNYLPSPVVMAAAIAARTRSLRIDLVAVPAPFHDPLRLAEDLAVADLISNGRLGVVVAGGYVASEFAMFDRRPSERPGAVVEMIETLDRAWTGEPFEFRGRTVQVLPRPVQRPRPALLMGGASRAAARRAARIADGFVPTAPEPWEDYRAAVQELGRPDPGPMAARGQSFHYIAEDPEAAWELIAPYCLHEANAYARWAVGTRTASDYSSGAEEPPPTLDAGTVKSMGIYPVLTPDQAVAECRRVGAVGFALHPLCGGMPPHLAWESLRLFEHEVLPALRG